MIPEAIQHGALILGAIFGPLLGLGAGACALDAWLTRRERRHAAALYAAGKISINEFRRREGLPPISDVGRRR